MEEAPVEEAPVEEAPVEEAAIHPEAVAQPALEVAEEVPRVVLTEDMLMENPQNPLPLAFGDDEAGHVTMVEDEAAEREGGSQALPDDWVDRVSDTVIRRLAGILPRLIQDAVNEHAAGTLPADESHHAEKDLER